MKLIKYIFCAMLFVGVAKADTININWIDGNTTYAQTTCTVGGDVILPTISKRGYVFRGWLPVFYRGTFTNWDNVPADGNNYLADFNGLTTPTNNDYIVIKNGETIPDKNIAVHVVHSNDIKITVDGITYTVPWNTPFDYTSTNQYIVDTDGIVSLYGARYGDSNAWVEVIINRTYVYNKQTRQAGTIVREMQSWTNTDDSLTAQGETGQYQGTWKLYYNGTWETDGKTGWKPAYQITNQNE